MARRAQQKSESDQRLWQIEHGDGVVGLLNHGSIDHVIADVPSSTRYDVDMMTDEARLRLARSIGHCCRRWCVLFTSFEEVAAWRSALEQCGMDYYGTGQWVRLQSTLKSNDDGPIEGAEAIVLAHSRTQERRWNGGGKPSIWYAPIVQGADRVHPTQKPGKLMLELISDFTDTGETICDPTMGSGTTGCSAVSLGRRFVGYEINANHFANARERLESMEVALTGPCLFPPRQGTSWISRARMELERSIVDLLSVANGDGRTLGELATTLCADEGEVYRAIKKLQKKKSVRREGRTVDTRYFSAQGAGS